MAENHEGAGAGGAPHKKKKCPKMALGAPLWMITYADMITLLMTFFILLLTFSSQEKAKYEAMLVSIQNTIGGGPSPTLVLGKSLDNAMSMLDSASPAKPFPIEFMSGEGLLDKHEVNRESTETVKALKRDLSDFSLLESVDFYEFNEGMEAKFKNRIFFKKGTSEIEDINVEDFEEMVQLLRGRDWAIFVEGHASVGETSPDGHQDALSLSAARSAEVARSLIKRGVRPQKITTVFYGDTRPEEGRNEFVEFTLRKLDLKNQSRKVYPR